MVEIGQRLKELRQQQEWTQEQVATRIGVTISVISAYETGIRQPSYKSLIKLAHIFDVSSDYLLGISGRHTSEGKHTISLDGLSPSKISLVTQLVDYLKE